MLRLLPYIVLSAVISVMLLYMHDYQPALWTHLLIKVDVLGITHEAKEEQERLVAIEALPIHYEEKKVLVDHTVFMGATPEMVKLALGTPQKVFSKSAGGTGNAFILTYYVYFLSNDIRPTILVFQQDETDGLYKLINAYKGSTLDLGN